MSLAEPDGALAVVEATRWEPRADGTPVYNFEVAGAHTYYVAAQGIRAPPVLVHNKCGTIAEIAENTGKYADEAATATRASASKAALDLNVGTYDDLLKLVKDRGLKDVEVHHLLPQRFAKALGMNSGEMMAVILPKGDKGHQLWTNLWRAKIPYGTSTTVSGDTVKETAKTIYQHMPEWLEKLGLQ